MDMKDLALPAASLGVMSLLAARGMLGPKAQGVAAQIPGLGMAVPDKGGPRVPVPIYKPNFIDKVKEIAPKLPAKGYEMLWRKPVDWLTQKAQGTDLARSPMEVFKKRVSDPIRAGREERGRQKSEGEEILKRILGGQSGVASLKLGDLF